MDVGRWGGDESGLENGSEGNFISISISIDISISISISISIGFNRFTTSTLMVVSRRSVGVFEANTRWVWTCAFLVGS